MVNVVENIKVLSDHEIRLVLSLGLEEIKEFYYNIEDIHTQEKIGECRICLMPNSGVEYIGDIGYEIFEPYRGNHFAYKASMLLSNVALLFGVRKVSLTADPVNFASIKTIEKLGARFLCVKKALINYRLYQDKKHDIACYEWILEEKGKQR